MPGQVIEVEGHHAQDERVQAQPKDRDVDQEQRVERRHLQAESKDCHVDQKQYVERCQHAHGQVRVQEKAKGSSQKQASAERHPGGNNQQRQCHEKGDNIVSLLLCRAAKSLSKNKLNSVMYHAV